jgi:hypothetical protein
MSSQAIIVHPLQHIVASEKEILSYVGRVKYRIWENGSLLEYDEVIAYPFEPLQGLPQLHLFMNKLVNMKAPLGDLIRKVKTAGKLFGYFYVREEVEIRAEKVDGFGKKENITKGFRISKLVIMLSKEDAEARLKSLQDYAQV